MPHYLLTVLLVVGYGSAQAADDDVAALAAHYAKRLQAARYLEGVCEPVSLPGWPDLPTQRCRYPVTDKKTGVAKIGLVVMLNPSPLKLSTWVVNACQFVDPTHPLATCAHWVMWQVLRQSGGQFPIAGIVYEDLLPADGINEAYGFRDGVTTVLTGVKHRATEPLSSEELEAAITAQPLRTASQAGFARIIGVTRAEFLQANPTAQVNGLEWLTTVRQAYQTAWTSDRNALIEAWLAAHLP